MAGANINFGDMKSSALASGRVRDAFPVCHERCLSTQPSGLDMIVRQGPILFCQAPLFQPSTRRARPQCAAVMDIHGDHLLRS